MKTIKQCKESVLDEDIYYEQALRDMLGLIDEIPNLFKNWKAKEELKKRITG